MKQFTVMPSKKVTASSQADTSSISAEVYNALSDIAFNYYLKGGDTSSEEFKEEMIAAIDFFKEEFWNHDPEDYE